MVLPVVRSYRLFWLVVLLYAGRPAAQRLLTGAATQKIAVHGKEQVVYIANDKGTIDTKMQVGVADEYPLTLQYNWAVDGMDFQ